jgi:hypothetical protein
MKSTRILIITHLISLLCIGCQTTNKNTSLLDEKNENKNIELPNFHFLSTDDTLDRYKGIVKPSVAIYLEKDAYLINDTETIRQIHSVLTKLKSCWKGDAPTNIDIIIEGDPLFGARTDQYNQVFLTTGFLNKIKNDDQLAAVLAHELSHILLKHNQDKSVYQSMPWTFEKAGAMAVLVESKFAPEEKNKTALLTTSLSATWADIGSPAWTRENEREADKLGLDLLIKAGYDPEAFFSIMLDLQQAQINQGKRLKEMAEKTKTLLIEKAPSSSSIPVDFIEAPLTDLFGQIIDRTIDSLHNTLAKKNVDYDSPEERQDKLKTYFSEAYPDLYDTPKTKKDVWLAIQNGSWKSMTSAKNDSSSRNSKHKSAKLKKKKSKKTKRTASHLKTAAAQNDEKNNADFITRKFSFEDLIASDYLPAIAYIQVAQNFMDKKNDAGAPQKAFEALQLGSKRIGSNYRFYPYLIPAAKMKGDNVLAEQYTRECSKNRDTDYMQILIDLLDKNKAVSPMYSECVKALGYDPLVRK